MAIKWSDPVSPSDPVVVAVVVVVVVVVVVYQAESHAGSRDRYNRLFVSPLPRVLVVGSTENIEETATIRLTNDDDKADFRDDNFDDDLDDNRIRRFDEFR